MPQSYYNPYQYQPSYSQFQSQYTQQNNQGLLWVQGEAGAKSYLVAPNTTVLLMDSESQRFYLKSSDNTGMPVLRSFEYTEIKDAVPTVQAVTSQNLDEKYVTRKEYEELEQKYAEIADKMYRMEPMSGNNAVKVSRGAGNE